MFLLLFVDVIRFNLFKRKSSMGFPTVSFFFTRIAAIVDTLLVFYSCIYFDMLILCYLFIYFVFFSLLFAVFQLTASRVIHPTAVCCVCDRPKHASTILAIQRNLRCFSVLWYAMGFFYLHISNNKNRYNHEKATKKNTSIRWHIQIVQSRACCF